MVETKEPLLPALNFYREMLRIRKFEEKVNFLFSRGLIHGTAHLYIGQEAIAVGVCSAINQDDFLTSTHRGHGHALAKGLCMKKFLAELQGKSIGYCGGRGGTQHTVALELGFLANGITGGSAVTGTGIALAYKMQDLPKIVVSFFGDGAVNEGHLHEALNLASVWKLPIIYVCENNLYAMSTHVKEAAVHPDLYKRAEIYGMKSFCIDGNDVETVFKTIQLAAEQARKGQGPVFIECKTYRQCGHSKNDLCIYRTREEEQAWKEKDPLAVSARKLQALSVSSEELEKIRKEVDEEIEQAVSFAQEALFPEVETLYDHVYAE